MNDTSSPIDCLMTLLTVDIVDDLVRNINEYVAEKIMKYTPMRKASPFSRWEDITREDFFRFLSVVIAMGLTPKGDVKDYWSTTPHKYTPWFGLAFSRTKFLLIFQSMLHAAQPDAQGKAKIEPFISALLGRFQAAFYPYENVSIDEMVIGFKGRFHAKQYNSKKPKKYHIKTFGICDSITGYCYDLFVYYGADTAYVPEADPNSQAAIKVFANLLRNLNGKHHIFADRFYSSLPLVTFLQSKNLNYTGTVDARRVGLPPQLKETETQVGSPRWFLHDDMQVMCVSWKDSKSKKPCVALSTFGSSTYVTRQEGLRPDVVKPSIIHSYNQMMNGCDRMDQLVAYYGGHSRKTMKW